MISLTFKSPLKTRLGICIDKTLHQHRPNEYIGFTPSCPPHILQQNCAHGADSGLWMLTVASTWALAYLLTYLGDLKYNVINLNMCHAPGD